MSMQDAQILILNATQRLHRLPIDAVQKVIEFIASLEAQLVPFYSNGHTEPVLDEPQEQLSDNILELRRELIEDYGDGPVPLDTPFIGGITLGEYYALSDEEQGQLWDKESEIGLVESVITFDKRMINNWQNHHATIHEQLETMKRDLQEPYCNVSLPQVLRPDQL